MSGGWRARDHELLDALDKLDRVPLNDTVWRVVRGERDPLLCHSSGGRWDSGHFDVLYTSFDPDGAISEMYFHLSRQPIFPSKIEFVLAEIAVTTQSTLRFADLGELVPLGVDPESYANLLYRRTQEMGDAAVFLGFDGIVAPSARWECQNLAVFCDNVGPDDLVLNASSTVDWRRWRQRNRKMPSID